MIKCNQLHSEVIAMSEILSRGHRVTNVYYCYRFKRKDVPGAGFSFECDKEGNIFPLEYEEAKESLRMCQDGTLDVIDEGVVKYENSYWQPTVIKCDCGRELDMSDVMTNRCECGRFYNGCGQELAPPSQWGWDTGEEFDEYGNQTKFVDD
jgi:hypothetical protein